MAVKIHEPNLWKNCKTAGCKVGQLEKLSNSELQKEFMKDKARGKEHLWQSPTNRRHQENLRDLHERARGKHGNIRRDS